MSAVDPKLIEESARHAVMIRIRGQDSLGVKTLGRPFHKMNGGFTTLSASGLLLDRRYGYTLTSATLLSPFMQGEGLRKGVIVEMMTNGLSGALEESESDLKWIPLKFVRTLRDTSLRALLQRFRGDADWTSGWPRNTDSSSGHLGEMDLARRDAMSTAFWAGFEDLALLQIDFEQNSGIVSSKLNSLRRDLQHHAPQLDFNVVDPSSISKGQHLLLIASPYGILSPSVFHNCVYTTMVSNILSLDPNSRIYGHLVHEPPVELGKDGLLGSTSSNASNSGTMLTPTFQHPPPTPVSSVTTTLQQGRAKARRLKNVVLDKLPSSQAPPAPSPTIINHPSVIFIDQPGLPGCEGGPVFDSKGSIVGLLAPPLRRNDGSNVEVHLVLPLHPFIQQIRELTPKQSPLLDLKFLGRSEFKLEPVAAQTSPIPLSSQSMPNSAQISEKVLPSIVVVSTGTYWGSGVVISAEGHILTSAHIFRSFLASNSRPYSPVLQTGCHVDIRIDFGTSLVPPSPPSRNATTLQLSSQGSSSLPSYQSTPKPMRAHWYRASLIYVSSSHLDVAVVKLDHVPSHLAILPICEPIEPGGPVATREAQEGEAILAVGFALFGPSKRILATCTSGIISRIAHLHGQPKLIQSSAAVNKGASGGALIDQNGNFVGLVTCNAMTKEGVIIPKINFSIPAQLLYPVHAFVTTHDQSHLEAIERKDDVCAALWSMTALSEDPTDSQPNNATTTTFPFLNVPRQTTNQVPAPGPQKFIEYWKSQTSVPFPTVKL